jgi:precorrin-2 methylase
LDFSLSLLLPRIHLFQVEESSISAVERSSEQKKAKLGSFDSVVVVVVGKRSNQLSNRA